MRRRAFTARYELNVMHFRLMLLFLRVSIIANGTYTEVYFI
jgi:hypothetical protein